MIPVNENLRLRLINCYCIYLSLAPFLFCFSNASAPFELIKLLALVVFSFSVATILAISWLKSGEILIQWNEALTILVALMLVNFFSYCFSINRYLSFWGDDQLPSDSLLSVLALFAFCFSITQLQPSKKNMIDFLKTMCFTASLLATHALLQFFGFEFSIFQQLPALKGKLIATIGQPVLLSTVLACTVPLFSVLIRIEKKMATRLFLIAGFAVTEYALLLSDSRTPWLLNIVALILCMPAWLRHLRGKFRTLTMLTCSLIVALFVILQICSPLNKDLRGKFFYSSVEKGLQSRLLIWRDGLASFPDHWLVGSGPETFGIEQKKHQSIELNRNEYWKTYWAKAHNAVVQFAVTTGLLGLLSFLSIYFYIAVYLFKNRRNSSNDVSENGLQFHMALSAFVIFLCNLTAFNYILTQTYTSFLFVLFVIWKKKSSTQSFRAPVNGFYRLAIGAVIALQLGFIGATAAYWYSDILLQKSYQQLNSQGDSDKSLDLANQAAILNSSNPFVYCHRANVLLNLVLNFRARMTTGQISDILHDITIESRTCVDLAPNRYQTHLSRGRAFSVLFQQGLSPDSAAAETSYIEFSKLAPKHPGPYFEIATLDLRNHKIDAFTDKMNTVIALKPDFIPAYTELIKYYFKVKNYEQVETLVSRMITTDFKSGEFVPELRSVAALCHDNGKQNLADLLENFYLKNKGLILKTY